MSEGMGRVLGRGGSELDARRLMDGNRDGTGWAEFSNTLRGLMTDPAYRLGNEQLTEWLYFTQQEQRWPALRDLKGALTWLPDGTFWTND
jgi:hypothetical protein